MTLSDLQYVSSRQLRWTSVSFNLTKVVLIEFLERKRYSCWWWIAGWHFTGHEQTGNLINDVHTIYICRNLNLVSALFQDFFKNYFQKPCIKTTGKTPFTCGHAGRLAEIYFYIVVFEIKNYRDNVRHLWVFVHIVGRLEVLDDEDQYHVGCRWLEISILVFVIAWFQAHFWKENETRLSFSKTIKIAQVQDTTGIWGLLILLNCTRGDAITN